MPFKRRLHQQRRPHAFGTKPVTDIAYKAVLHQPVCPRAMGYTLDFVKVSYNTINYRAIHTSLRVGETTQTDNKLRVMYIYQVVTLN